MSKKAKDRVLAKQAVGDRARVDKIEGNLVVTRTEESGRMRDWQRFVKKAVRSAIAGWNVVGDNGNVLVFAMKKGG